MIKDWFKNGFDDEVDQLINLEAANRAEILVRHAILILMCLTGAVYFQVWFPIIWVAIYCTMSLIVRVAFSRMSLSRSLRDYKAYLATSFFQMFSFRVMTLYMWFFPHEAAHFLGFIMLLASMRYSVNLKARVNSYLLIYAIGDITVFSVLAYDFLFRQSFEGSFLIGIAFIATILYYIVTLRQNLTFLKELQILEERTRQSQKMEAVGRLTGGVAHDFNNILTVVMGNLELHEMTPDPEERRDLRQQTRDAASRAAELTSQLLAFSRQSPLTQSDHEITEIFSKVKKLSERLLPANIDFKPYVAPWTSKIRVDGTQLEVALLNLIINARDAMPEGGRLKLTAHNQHLNATDGLAKSGTFVCIDLVDEGCGIPEDILDKVVEPFFTTKPVGKGSGLGLSKVKGFAEQSGGFLHILTKPGISTTVCVCLPAILEGPDLDTNNEPQMFLP